MHVPKLPVDLQNVWRRAVDDRFVALSGPDSGEWLQGQATQNVQRLEVGQSAEFCLCTPTGQIAALAQVYRRPEDWLVAVPEVCLPALLQRLEETVILEDMAWNVLPGGAFPFAGFGSSSEPEVPDARFGVAGGWFSEQPPGRELSLEEWDFARFAAGVPAMGLDVDAKVLPPELGPAFEERTVSYAKGCYVGQEVLMRLHSRGHTNRVWVALVLGDGAQPGPLQTPAGTPAGTLMRRVGSSPWGSALVRNAFAEPRTVLRAGGVEAEVVALPLRRASS